MLVGNNAGAYNAYIVHEMMINVQDTLCYAELIAF